MSSTSTQSILPLTSSNWSTWWPKMESAVMATKGMWVNKVSCPALLSTSGANEIQLYIKWTEANTKILGIAHQALFPAILHQYQSEHVTADLIKALKDVYGIQGLPQVYANFKAIMETMIPVNNHPGPAFTRFQTLFTKLSQAKYTIPDNIQAMIILSCLLHTMLIVMQLFAKTKDSTGNVIASTLPQITAAATLN